MTGPEHYREAESLMASAQPGEEARNAALAQVHATLALAAATGLNDADTGFSGPDWAAWRDVAGEPPRAVAP